jgi:hypothetical protein
MLVSSLFFFCLSGLILVSVQHKYLQLLRKERKIARAAEMRAKFSSSYNRWRR